MPEVRDELIAVAATVARSYACPMHPEVTGEKGATCPKCGMKLVWTDAPAASPGEPEHGHDGSDGLEWGDLMPGVNRQTNPSNMIWKLIDRQTGDENGAIRWAFTVGDRVKI